MPYTYGAPRLRDVVGASRGRVRCAVTGYFKAVHTVVAKTPLSIVARRRLAGVQRVDVEVCECCPGYCSPRAAVLPLSVTTPAAP